MDNLVKLSLLKMMQHMSSGKSNRKSKKLPGLPYWEDSSDEDPSWSSSSKGGRGIEAVEKLRVAMKNHPEPYQERMEQKMMKAVEATELDASVPAKYIKTIPVGKSRTAGYAIAGFAEILKLQPSSSSPSTRAGWWQAESAAARSLLGAHGPIRIWARPGNSMCTTDCRSRPGLRRSSTSSRRRNGCWRKGEERAPERGMAKAPTRTRATRANEAQPLVAVCSRASNRGAQTFLDWPCDYFEGLVGGDLGFLQEFRFGGCSLCCQHWAMSWSWNTSSFLSTLLVWSWRLCEGVWELRWVELRKRCASIWGSWRNQWSAYLLMKVEADFVCPLLERDFMSCESN